MTISGIWVLQSTSFRKKSCKTAYFGGIFSFITGIRFSNTLKPTFYQLVCFVYKIARKENLLAKKPKTIFYDFLFLCNAFPRVFILMGKVVF